MAEADVINGLRNSSKGKIKYDPNWFQEGRTKDIVDDISSQLTCLHISPKALSLVSNANISSTSCGDDGASVENVTKTCPLKKVKSSTTLSDKHKMYGHTNDLNDTYYIMQVALTEIPIIKYEEEQQQKHLKEMYNKKAEYEKFARDKMQQVNEQYYAYTCKSNYEFQRRAGELEFLEQMYLKKIKDDLQSTFNQRDAQAVIEKVQEVEAKKQAERNVEEKKKETEELQKKIQACQEHLIVNFASKAVKLLSSFDHKEFLKETPNEYANDLTEIIQSMSSIVKELKERTPVQEDFLKAQAFVDEARDILQNVSIDIDQARTKALQVDKEKKRDKESSPASKIIPEPAVLPTENQSDNFEPADDMEEDVNNYSAPDKTLEDEHLADHMDSGAFHEYCKIIQNLTEWESAIEPFATNTKHKMYRLELHRAVTTPINAISSLSGSHVRDKVNRLSALLSGQSVESGNKVTSCKHDPLAEKYCKNLIAKKFVAQGEEQVASKFPTAFPIAASAVALCSMFPDIWPLILGHLYRKCPFIVPFYPPRYEDQSEVSYLMSLGYKYIDDVCEKQDKYLKRMSGFVHLYAAILMTVSPPGFPMDQTYGLRHGWTWAARILNMDPRPDITATVLLDFLYVVGQSLAKAYRRQFTKLLHFICKDYFPRIKQVTESGAGGPVSRLEAFLQTALKKGNIPNPGGLLGSNFWNT